MTKALPATAKRDLVREAVSAYRDVGHTIYGTGAPPAILDMELTMAQLKALLVVERIGRAAMSQVADRLGIGLPAASHLADRLAAAKLIERAEDPADRRRTIVHVTPGGRALMERMREQGIERLGPALSRLDPEDLEALVRGLKAFSKALEAAVKEEQGAGRRSTRP